MSTSFTWTGTNGPTLLWILTRPRRNGLHERLDALLLDPQELLDELRMQY